MNAIHTQDVAGRARYLAVAAAAVTAVLYYLIGLGVLNVGRSTRAGEGTDLFAFGVMAGTAFVVIAGLLFRFRSRLLWIAIGLFQVMVIVMYFAVSTVREPPFELWGILIKALQVVVLGSVAYLFARRG